MLSPIERVLDIHYNSFSVSSFFTDLSVLLQPRQVKLKLLPKVADEEIFLNTLHVAVHP